MQTSWQYQQGLELKTLLKLCYEKECLEDQQAAFGVSKKDSIVNVLVGYSDDWYGPTSS